MGNKLPSKFHIPKKKPKQGESPAEPSVQDAPKRQLPKVPEKPPTSNKQMGKFKLVNIGYSFDLLFFTYTLVMMSPKRRSLIFIILHTFCNIFKYIYYFIWFYTANTTTLLIRL